MDKLTNDVRIAYKEACAMVTALEKQVRPQIQAIEADAGLPAARAILEEIVNEVGEHIAVCEGCSVHIFDGDDYSTDDEGEVYACAGCVERWKVQDAEADQSLPSQSAPPVAGSEAEG